MFRTQRPLRRRPVPSGNRMKIRAKNLSHHPEVVSWPSCCGHILVLLVLTLATTKSHSSSVLFAEATRTKTTGYARRARVEPYSIRDTFLQIRGGDASRTVERTKFNGFTRKTEGSTRGTKKGLQAEKPERFKKPSIARELKNDPRVMLLIRLLFLCYYGSLGSLMPFLPVYYHHLGHGGQIIGLLGAVKPFTTFLVAPLWGLISDKSQQPFLILQVTFLVSLVGQLLVSFRHESYYIMAMVFWTALFNAPVKSLIDSMVMDHMSDTSEYGRLRLWGQMGFGLGSSAVGMILSKSKHIPWPESTSFTPSFEETLATFPAILQQTIRFADKCWRSLTGYKLLFFAYAALSVPTWICVRAFRRLDIEQKAMKEKGTVSKKTSTDRKSSKRSSERRIAEGLLVVARNTDTLFFFSLILMVGISSGVIENFAYVRMREVGGTGKEMGFNRLVSSLAGAPMFWFSGPLTELLGADRVIVLSLMSYVVRFCIYALMRNPYHGLPAEALRGVTFAAFWSSGTIYAHRVSPPGLHATMLMFLNAMYGGLGQSVGAIIGGKLQHRYGTVRTFLYSAAVNMSVVCAVIAYLCLRKESNFRDPKPLVASSAPPAKAKEQGRQRNITEKHKPS